MSYGVVSDGIYAKQQRRFEMAPSHSVVQNDSGAGERHPQKEDRQQLVPNPAPEQQKSVMQTQKDRRSESAGMGLLSSIFGKGDGSIGITLGQDELIILAVLLIVLTGSEERDLLLILALVYVLLDF